VAFKISDTKKSAKIRNSITPVRSKEALDNITNHFANATATNPYIAKALSRFTRTIEEHIEESKTMPHSRPTVKSIVRKTKFPSIEAIIREKAEKKESEEALPRIAASSNLAEELLASAYSAAGVPHPTVQKGHGRSKATTSFSLDQTVIVEIKQSIEDEHFKLSNDKRGRPIPALSEKMIEFEHELERMGRLRTLHDKVAETAKSKKNELMELRLQVEKRNREDELVIADLIAGK
jgi:hypothetical protein